MSNGKDSTPPAPPEKEPESSKARYAREYAEHKEFVKKMVETMKSKENTIERLHGYPPTFPNSPNPNIYSTGYIPPYFTPPLFHRTPLRKKSIENGSPSAPNTGGSPDNEELNLEETGLQCSPCILTPTTPQTPVDARLTPRASPSPQTPKRRLELQLVDSEGNITGVFQEATPLKSPLFFRDWNSPAKKDK